MSEFWTGVLCTISVAVAVPALFAVIAALAMFWFEHGPNMVRPKPWSIRDRFDRATHGAVIFASARTVRLFWIGGLAVYVVQQGRGGFGGESHMGNIRDAIIRADQDFWNAQSQREVDRDGE